jgi:hypothetical protein
MFMVISTETAQTDWRNLLTWPFIGELFETLSGGTISFWIHPLLGGNAISEFFLKKPQSFKMLGLRVYDAWIQRNARDRGDAMYTRTVPCFHFELISLLFVTGHQ